MRVCLCVMFAMFCMTTFAAEPDPAEPAGRIALRDVRQVALARDMADREDIPWVTIGAGPKPDPRARLMSPESAFVQAPLEVRAPEETEPTYAFVVGPTLDSGEMWRVAEVARRGNRFTILVEVFEDNIPRLKNVRTRTACAVPLGTLPAGQYEVAVRWMDYFRDVEAKTQYYHERDRKGATAKVTINAAERTELNPAVKIMGKDFEGVSQPAVIASSRQLPYRTEMETAPARVEGVIQVGALKQERAQGEAPQLAPPTKEDRMLYAVIAPDLVLSTGEWVEVRQVIWSDQVATITLEIWRDNGPRRKNVEFRPMVVVPLDVPLAKGGQVQPGKYRIQVRQEILLAPQQGGLYEHHEKESRRLGEPEALFAIE